MKGGGGGRESRRRQPRGMQGHCWAACQPASCVTTRVINHDSSAHAHASDGVCTPLRPPLCCLQQGTCQACWLGGGRGGVRHAMWEHMLRPLTQGASETLRRWLCGERPGCGGCNQLTHSAAWTVLAEASLGAELYRPFSRVVLPSMSQGCTDMPRNGRCTHTPHVSALLPGTPLLVRAGMHTDAMWKPVPGSWCH